MSASWTRESRYQPPNLAAFDALGEGRHSLESCLDRLGAPLWVWETEDGQSALAWGWLNEQDLGFRVSVPLADYVSASFNYNNIDSRMQGLVLFFDGNLELAATRRGLLRDLTQLEERRRPQSVEPSDP